MDLACATRYLKKKMKQEATLKCENFVWSIINFNRATGPQNVLFI